MAEPLPPLPDPPATPARLTPTADATAAAVIDLDEVDAPADWDEGVEELDDLADRDDLEHLAGGDDRDDGISVPPLEPIGSMSRAASQALFGD
jgi:hypothetical protein